MTTTTGTAQQPTTFAERLRLARPTLADRLAPYWTDGGAFALASLRPCDRPGSELARRLGVGR